VGKTKEDISKYCPDSILIICFCFYYTYK